MKGPNINLKIIGIFLQGHPQKGPPVYRNSQFHMLMSGQDLQLHKTHKLPTDIGPLLCKGFHGAFVRLQRASRV